jgi:hypothetical protein
MTTIQVTIKVNEEHIREKAITTYQKARQAAYRHYRRAAQIAQAIGSGYCPSPGVARVYLLLAKPKKYVRPTHDLFCSCRTCEPSINTYCKRIMSL